MDEKTKAAYAMLNFGGPQANIFGHINVVGNVGVRVVRTEEQSAGSVGYPTPVNLLRFAPCGTPLSVGNVVNPACYLTPQILAFANGGGTPNTYTSSHTNALPSFNVRFGLDDKDYVRFAYSRAISRPDIGYLRNFVQINSPVINTAPDSRTWCTTPRRPRTRRRTSSVITSCSMRRPATPGCCRKWRTSLICPTSAISGRAVPSPRTFF